MITELTLKEKALELVRKMYLVDKFDEFKFIPMQYEHAKQCALIAVDEMLKVISTGSYNETFYKQVKQEIDKL